MRPRAFHPMTIDDYDEVLALWKSLPGVGLHEHGVDSRAGIERYLSQNPGQSFVCKADGQIVGTILCGNDGRRVYIHHLAVASAWQHKGIATELLRRALDAQKALGMTKGHVFVKIENETGKTFWRKAGFATRHDLELMSGDF